MSNLVRWPVPQQQPRVTPSRIVGAPAAAAAGTFSVSHSIDALIVPAEGIKRGKPQAQRVTLPSRIVVARQTFERAHGIDAIVAGVVAEAPTIHRGKPQQPRVVRPSRIITRLESALCEEGFQDDAFQADAFQLCDTGGATLVREHGVDALVEFTCAEGFQADAFQNDAFQLCPPGTKRFHSIDAFVGSEIATERAHEIDAVITRFGHEIDALIIPFTERPLQGKLQNVPQPKNLSRIFWPIRALFEIRTHAIDAFIPGNALTHGVDALVSHVPTRPVQGRPQAQRLDRRSQAFTSLPSIILPQRVHFIDAVVVDVPLRPLRGARQGRRVERRPVIISVRARPARSHNIDALVEETPPASYPVAATGTLYVAPIGTPGPTNATSPLNVAFKDMGFISEDGAVWTVHNMSIPIQPFDAIHPKRYMSTGKVLNIECDLVEFNKRVVETVTEGTIVPDSPEWEQTPWASNETRKSFVLEWTDQWRYRLYIPVAVVTQAAEYTLSRTGAAAVHIGIETINSTTPFTLFTTNPNIGGA